MINNKNYIIFKINCISVINKVINRKKEHFMSIFLTQSNI